MHPEEHARVLSLCLVPAKLTGVYELVREVR